MTNLRILLMLIITAISAYADSGRTCKIKTMVGDVQIERHGSNKWTSAKVGVPISESDAVRTFVESSAELETGEGTILSIGENSTIELKAFSGTTEGAGNTSVRILNGTLLANVKKLVGAGSSFDFKTPTAVASIRGTKVGFDVGTDSTGISVYEGHVLVTPNGANSGTMLTGNQRTTVQKGKTTVTVEKFTAPVPASAADLKPKPPVATKPDSTVHKTDSTAAPVKDTSLHPVDSTLKKIPADSIAIPAHTLDTATKKLPVDTVAPAVNTPAVIPSSKDTVSQSGIPSGNAAQNAILILKLSSPVDHSTVVKPQLTVSGVTTPGASVSINGVSAAVGGDGAFSRDVFFPNEDGDHQVDVEASLGSQNKSASLTITYKSPTVPIGVIVNQPSEGQTVCNLNVPVSGTLKSKTATISVNGRTIRNNAGSFSDFAQIAGGSPGSYEIRFDSNDGNTDTSITRDVIYDPAGSKQCNTQAPTVVGSIPISSSAPVLTFTINDATLYDELTAFTSIDGRSESQSLLPGAQISLDLAEGRHSYSIWASDKVGNLSKTLSGQCSCIPSSTIPSISVRAPAGGSKTMLIPPGNPEASFEPSYTIEFDILNIPSDDPKLVSEVDVTQTSGGNWNTSMKQLSSLSDISTDVNLSKGINAFQIKLTDVTGRIITKTISITVK